MRIDAEIKLSKDVLLSDNSINKDTVQIHEVEIVGKPRIFIEDPKLVFDEENNKAGVIGVRLQISPSGTVHATYSPVPKKDDAHLEAISAVKSDSKPGRTSSVDATGRINETRANPLGEPNPNVKSGSEITSGKGKSKKSKSSSKSTKTASRRSTGKSSRATV